MNEDRRTRHALAVKKWRAKRPDKVHEYNQRHYRKHKLALQTQTRLWVFMHPESRSLYGKRSAAKRKLKYPGERAASSRAHRQRVGPLLRAFVADRKKEGCSRCGEGDPVCLDFHHVDRSSKGHAIANMVRTYRSIASVANEMEKCVLLCANCHRKEHGANKASYGRREVSHGENS